MNTCTRCGSSQNVGIEFCTSCGNQMGQTQIIRQFVRGEDKKIVGVCSGLGIYYNIDAATVRIIFIVFSLLGGSGILLYFLLALIMPEPQYYNTD